MRVLMIVSWDSELKDRKVVEQYRMVKAHRYVTTRNEVRIEKQYGLITGWILEQLGKFECEARYGVGDMARKHFEQDLKTKRITALLTPAKGAVNVKTTR
jgi:hypothetical protein